MTSKPLALVLLALVGLAGAGTSIAACVGDDGATAVTPPPNDGGSEASTTTAAKANGAACTGAGDCQSGTCADGVCCDTKCDGICEKCNLPGTVGTCTAIPDGQDPDTECPTAPLDAGAVTIVDGGDTSDAGDASVNDSGLDDGGVTTGDAGVLFSYPDGGLPATSNTQCAGHCNGKRACAYAGKETTCGAVFCGNESEQGRASCDGAGHCLYGVEECDAYACPNGSPGCKSSCSGPSDCLAGYYCDATGACKPQNGNGAGCANGLQCSSGYCVGSVCCENACDIPQGTCSAAGQVGKCSCSACATGPCEAYYPDADGDGFGDMNAQPTYGCVGAPPAGTVANNKDCFDSATAAQAKNVFPGQTSYFETGYSTTPGGSITFDYDCSGSADKYYREEPACGVCHVGFENNAHVVVLPPLFCSLYTGASCSQTNEATGHSCIGCGNPDNSAVFETATACGQTGYLYDCNPCSGSGAYATSHYVRPQAQACH